MNGINKLVIIRPKAIDTEMKSISEDIKTVCKS